MSQGGLTARIILIDADGNEIGTADLPIEVSSTELVDAIGELIAEIKALRDTIELVNSE